MNEPTLHELEQRLGALSAWDGPAPGLWKRALATLPVPTPIQSLQRVLAAPIPRPWLAAAAVVLVAGVVFLAMLPSLGRARSMRAGSDAAPAAAPGTSAEMVRRLAEVPGFQLAEVRGLAEVPLDRFMATTVGRAAALQPADRQVVRKATIEIVTPDVRAAFLKAAHLVSEASGEYVQESSLTGEGQAAAANLTLRVAAERLSTVLGGLRDLGAVHSEAATGEDVTEQVVDLEARIRNEQAAERELLELMQSRRDAPLKDILELRTTIAGVRESIERLQAQRERLGRLVSLATVLVIIRADPEGQKAESSVRTYFGDAIGASWDRGLRILTDTAAALVRILVGGAVWWALAIALFVWVRRRAKAAVAARERAAAAQTA